ncbi:MAG: oxidoreductase [Proteobacteria bacterium]|nr:oxidoreductase [Pseudomonadota bacterium]
MQAPTARPVKANAFRAYRTFDEDGKIVSRFVDMTVDELDPGDVVVRTKYSTINYKDALSHNGTGKIMRRFPTNAGIDMSGTVETSGDPRWKPGDKVIVHAYDFGVAHDGGYAELVRVPGDWVVRRPDAMSAFDAMAIGTAGFTAAQAVALMEHNGLKPANGPVAVTGATGGVGSVAIEILARRGYEVVAFTGKAEESGYLKSLGAHDVRLRQDIDLTKIRPLDKALWAGAVDNLGGPLLAWLLSTSRIAGTVTSIGLAADYKLPTTVMPFILRGVALLGVDSANAPMALRQSLWDRLAVEWRPDKVHDSVRTIDFDDLPSHFEAYLKGLVRGRTVVRIGADSHP